MRKSIFPVLVAVFLPLSTLGVQVEDDAMILVAGQASLIRAQTWIDFLTKNEVTVQHYVLSELSEVKNKPYITIMGGLEETGIKDILNEVIGAAETASLASEGAKKMFLKEDVWKPGQKVLVFAGNDAEEAAAIRTESRETWMEYLEEWFDMEEIPGGLRAY